MRRLNDAVSFEQEVARSMEAHAPPQQPLAPMDIQPAFAKGAVLEQHLAETQRLAASLQNSIQSLPHVILLMVMYQLCHGKHYDDFWALSPTT